MLNSYRVLADDEGRTIHLTRAVDDWLVPGRNPFGLYLYTEEVDGLAAAFVGETIGAPEDKPWGVRPIGSSGNADPCGLAVAVAWRARSQGVTEAAPFPWSV